MGFRVLRVSENKREGRNSGEKNICPSATSRWGPGMLQVPRKGSLSQCSGMGLCGAPLPGCREGWGGAGAVPWEPGASELGVQGVLHLRRQLGVEGGEAHPEICREREESRQYCS